MLTIRATRTWWVGLVGLVVGRTTRRNHPKVSSGPHHGRLHTKNQLCVASTRRHERTEAPGRGDGEQHGQWEGPTYRRNPASVLKARASSVHLLPVPFSSRALTPMTAAPRSGTSSRTTRSGGRWNIRSRWTRTATWRRSRTSYATSLPMHVPTCLPCRERGVRGLTREVETPLPSHPPVRPGAASVTTALKCFG
jgi:hypothetical protein